MKTLDITPRRKAFEQDVIKALSQFSHQSPKWVNGSYFSRRNRMIDMVINNYCKVYDYRLYLPRVYHDIASSESRAIHYGVAVGGTIKTFKRPRPDYNNIVASLKNDLRCIDWSYLINKTI